MSLGMPGLTHTVSEALGSPYFILVVMELLPVADEGSEGRADE